MPAGTHLGRNDLKKGDVLLLQDIGELTHKLIATGQAIFSHNKGAHANVVHAGIYDVSDWGNAMLLEAAGEKPVSGGSGIGLRAGGFAAKEAHYRFLVFRYVKSANVALQAVNLAHTLIGRSDGTVGRYETGSALASLMHRSKLGKFGKAALDRQAGLDANSMITNTKVYCSGFVVQCYALVDRNSISLDYRYVSPKRLQAELHKGNGWDERGYILAADLS